MDINEMLGIDLQNPGQWLANELLSEERDMLARLVEIRNATCTQDSIGKVMGVSQSAIAKIETGDRDPRLSTLRRYAAALGVLIRYDVQEQREWRSAFLAGREGSGSYTTHLRVKAAPRVTAEPSRSQGLVGFSSAR